LYNLILNKQKKLVSGINAKVTFDNRVAPTNQLASKDVHAEPQIDNRRPISSGSKTAEKKQKINVKKQDLLPIT